MKHFIAEKHLQGTLTQFSWQGYHDISQLKFTEDDFIWILTTDEDWPQTLLQAKQKVASVVLLTYRYDRVEMQAALNLGARAYCHALGKPSLYSSVVRVVDAGGIWMPNELLAALSPSVATSIKSKPVFTTLNGITKRTVKEHVGSLLNKFGAKDRINLLLHLGEFSHLRDAL